MGYAKIDVLQLLSLLSQRVQYGVSHSFDIASLPAGVFKTNAMLIKH